MAEGEVGKDVAGEVAHVEEESVVAEDTADPAEAEGERPAGQGPCHHVAETKVVLTLQEA